MILRFYLIVLALASAFAALVALRRGIRAAKRQRLARGQVVEWIAIADSAAPGELYYFPRIVFEDQSGQERAFVSRVGRGRPTRPLGAAWLVAYDPGVPEDAIEHDLIARWGWPASLAVISVLAFFSAAMV